MKLSDLHEAVRQVPKNSLTPKKGELQSKSEHDDDYDWKNPKHNPSGKKPAGVVPHKVNGKYDEKNYPMLDSEHGTHLFDPDYVSHMKSEYPSWNKMSELEQIKCQIDYMSGPPRSDYDHDKHEAALTKRAKALQAKIKR